MNAEASRGQAPTRTNFERFLGLGNRIVAKKPRVEGSGNLQELDSRRAIFATTHLSDNDETIAVSVLSSLQRQVDVASLETNQVVFALPVKAMGRDRFHDVENTFDYEANMPRTKFNLKDFQGMAEAMLQGKDIIISAHKPTRDWHLADKGGVGDVYLAHLTETPIVPVAIDIHSEKPVGQASDIKGTVRRFFTGKRPEVTVRIGKAITLDPMEPQDLEDVGQLLMGKRDELRKDTARYQRAVSNYHLLRQQSETVVSAISDLLPPEKRRQTGPQKAA